MFNPVDTEQTRVLIAMRRIIRRVDMYSRKINHSFQITVPQLICLYSLARNPHQTMSQLAKDINLGSSTLNGIADRLESKGLVIRRRSETDRRKVFLGLTDKGKELTIAAPPMLQERLARELEKLAPAEMMTITLALEKVAELMEKENIEIDIDANPVIESINII